MLLIVPAVRSQLDTSSGGSVFEGCGLGGDNAIVGSRTIRTVSASEKTSIRKKRYSDCESVETVSKASKVLVCCLPR